MAVVFNFTWGLEGASVLANSVQLVYSLLYGPKLVEFLSEKWWDDCLRECRRGFETLLTGNGSLLSGRFPNFSGFQSYFLKLTRSSVSR